MEQEERLYYFSYGSNMDKRMMRKRGVEIDEYKRAVLNGYKLKFSVPVPHRPWRAFAGIYPCKEGEEGEVEGVVYKIDKDEMRRMDFIEDTLRRKLYDRKCVKVKIEGEEEPKEAFTYIGLISRKGLVPSQIYLNRIIRGAKEHKLSEDYIRNLEELMSSIHRRNMKQGILALLVLGIVIFLLIWL